ncbi:hypothetical protein [Pelagibacterium sp. H642]|uniref:hypothetical protein n=1 Tax=Pelagibacterium sp. H642 TaxID=1881069 RepID=UPI002815F292|nr:hypothetical protein [Pelagibacterium sp. H642]WMT91755.1 hypothetical protein NO934_05690 [Pelagibacterium sp. H642]
MAEHPHEGRVVPVDQAMGDDANPLAALMPMSLDEINDYLYDESRPAEERLDRLREIRDNLAGLEASDVGSDVDALRDEVAAAIASLEGAELSAPDDAATSFDPADHIEAQSPDDEDTITRITGEEDAEDDQSRQR